MLPAMSQDDDPQKRAAQRSPHDADDVVGATGEADEGDAEERVETPFDHPLFLPAVLLGLSLWFLWDGFIVPMEEHLTFNRVGFAVLALATLWFGYKGVREMRADAESGPDPESR